MNSFILDENDFPRLVDLTEYYQWQKALPEDIKTGIGFTLALDKVEGVCVSTVYLGIDHGYGNGPPVLWETMVFCEGKNDQDFERSTSRKDALKVHRRFCEKYIG
jgi:hypothetical protein